MTTKVRQLPSGTSKQVFELPTGEHVEMTVYWDAIAFQARKAVRNKSRRSTDGPVLIKAVRK
jgi:hypothetical protein